MLIMVKSSRGVLFLGEVIYTREQMKDVLLRQIDDQNKIKHDVRMKMEVLNEEENEIEEDDEMDSDIDDEVCQLFVIHSGQLNTVYTIRTRAMMKRWRTQLRL